MISTSTSLRYLNGEKEINPEKRRPGNIYLCDNKNCTRHVDRIKQNQCLICKNYFCSIHALTVYKNKLGLSKRFHRRCINRFVIGKICNSCAKKLKLIGGSDD